LLTLSDNVSFGPISKRTPAREVHVKDFRTRENESRQNLAMRIETRLAAVTDRREKDGAISFE
jgi:hypothetical protein